VNNNDTPISTDAELKGLETRVSELIALVSRLSDENRALRSRQELLANERTTLLSRNDHVRTRVETMIARLKSMEHSA
jgi:cell division protein ZapB